MSTSSTSSSTSQALSLIAYVNIFCLVSLFVRPDDAFVRHHVRQGVLLMIIEFCATAMMIDPLFVWPGMVLFIFALLMSLIGIVTVLQNKTTPLPVIGWLVQVLHV